MSSGKDVEHCGYERSTKRGAKFLLTRALAGCLDFPRHAGGCLTPPPSLLTRLLGSQRETEKCVRKFVRNHWEGIFGQFLA